MANRKGKADMNELKERIKNEIFTKHSNRSTIIQILLNEGYTQSTADSYYAGIIREIKDDFKDRMLYLRELHIQLHEQNYKECDDIYNMKDRLIVRTKILERMEKITGLEETTVNHTGINIEIKIDPSMLPDSVKNKIT